MNYIEIKNRAGKRVLVNVGAIVSLTEHYNQIKNEIDGTDICCVDGILFRTPESIEDVINKINGAGKITLHTKPFEVRGKWNG